MEKVGSKSAKGAQESPTIVRVRVWYVSQHRVRSLLNNITRRLVGLYCDALHASIHYYWLENKGNPFSNAGHFSATLHRIPHLPYNSIPFLLPSSTLGNRLPPIIPVSRQNAFSYHRKRLHGYTGARQLFDDVRVDHGPKKFMLFNAGYRPYMGRGTNKVYR